ncbi:MAG: glycosyltransferase [Spirochaetia bacterium]|jgi:glycosyltransferase involved in cell wall biosynthesis/predicted metal-dependent phosphoesterase TrpH|nr:glycosyltransferase [Spirochaetia bacterium]
MKKIDLHVHSKYSSDSQNPVIAALGSRESYVEPEEIFEIALKRGMDYVTITDHDTIDGCLVIKNLHPDKVIMGVESTVFFPEDGCPVHILVYGLDKRQFEIIEKLRHNIYDFRNYLQTTKLAHSVAHTTYRLSDKFSIAHVEKLFALFDVFEIINGNRSEADNRRFADIVESLTPGGMYNLSNRHNITPYGSKPWVKGLTGGTDDHSGLFVGTTWTNINAAAINNIIPAIRCKLTSADGGSRTNKGFAFEIFKITMDNFAEKGGNPGELVTQIAAHVLENKKMGLINRYKIYMLKKSKIRLYRLLANIITEADKHYDSVDDKMNNLYNHIVTLSDEITRDFVNAVFNSFSAGNLSATLKAIPRTFASGLIYIPALFALKYMNKDLDFQQDLVNHFIKKNQVQKRKKKILWFTDTIADMNGVAVTLQNIGWIANKRGDDLHIVSSVTDEEMTPLLPPGLINLPPLVTFKLPYYEKLTVKVPSVLSMLENLEPLRPDEVFISSPSTVGLYGLLYSKVFGIKCTTVYHTDFTMQAKNIINSNTPLLKVIEKYTKWFHEASDRILVPTAEYIDILMRRGFDTKKMDIFHRGIDTVLFQPHSSAAGYIKTKYRVIGDINLLYAGRISEDKNINFLIEAVSPLFDDPELKINLLLAGDGPYLKTLKEKYARSRNIYFLGQIPNRELPLVYSGCEMLLFPSETDTFGMVVLEAQACGRPALVSDIGGPKNIVVDNETGYVLSTQDPQIWTNKLTELVGLIKSNSGRYSELCEKSRSHVIKEFDVHRILENYVGPDEDEEQKLKSAG